MTAAPYAMPCTLPTVSVMDNMGVDGSSLGDSSATNTGKGRRAREEGAKISSNR